MSSFIAAPDRRSRFRLDLAGQTKLREFGARFTIDDRQYLPGAVFAVNGYYFFLRPPSPAIGRAVPVDAIFISTQQQPILVGVAVLFFVAALTLQTPGAGYVTIASEAPQDVISRLERLPLTPFHMKRRFVIGARQTFFDLFDGIMIAFVIPALITPWALTPSQIGTLISAAYGGKFTGALFFGCLPGRIGRRRTILITTVFYGVDSLMLAAAWSYELTPRLRVRRRRARRGALGLSQRSRSPPRDAALRWVF